MNINNLTLEQAKSLAYDELAKIEIAQKNLQALNQLIAQKGVQFSEKADTIEDV